MAHFYIPFSTLEMQYLLDGRKFVFMYPVEPVPDTIKCVDGIHSPYRKDQAIPGPMSGDSFTILEPCKISTEGSDCRIEYEADRAVRELRLADNPDFYDDPDFRPAHCMPIWASRRTVCVAMANAIELVYITQSDVAQSGFRPLFTKEARDEFIKQWDRVYAETEFEFNRNPIVWRVWFFGERILE